MKNTIHITLLLCFVTLHIPQAHSEVTDQWDAQFAETIEQFASGSQVERPFDRANLTNLATKMSKKLLKMEKQWVHLLDVTMNQEELKTKRLQFASLPAIAKVMQTKPGTLIFEMTKYPNIIVKLDNRPEEDFDEKYRSYQAAFEKTLQVQVELRTFASLYLPLEIGNQLKGNVKVVFSEKVPLFSDSEIDNRVLLHLLHTIALNNDLIRQQMRIMFLQTIKYICAADFDDINFRNLPFTIDGRLAPIDTDSGSATTGVFNFIKDFFAYKILTLDEVTGAIKKTCREPYRSDPKNIIKLYSDPSESENTFTVNGERIAKIIEFLSARPSRIEEQPKLADKMDSVDDKQYSMIIDNLISEKLLNGTRDMQIFGNRCEHVTDFMVRISDGIRQISGKGLSMEAADQKAKQLLQIARFKNVVNSPGIPINNLSKLQDLRSYICF